MSHIGENIKKFVEEKKIPHQELWEIGKISRATFYNYLNGTTTPDGNFLRILVQKYGLKAYWLLTGEGEMEWGTARKEVKFICEHLFKDEDILKTLYHFLQWQLKNGKERKAEENS